MNKFKCPECKCLLSLVYPNTNANMACDCKCYFETKEGKKELQNYIDNYPKQYNKLFEKN